ncbi:UNVERIFIED_CONTAM: hypothetical protein K2H54_051633 [Gekko kuhli]
MPVVGTQHARKGAGLPTPPPEQPIVRWFARRAAGHLGSGGGGGGAWPDSLPAQDACRDNGWAMAFDRVALQQSWEVFPDRTSLGSKLLPLLGVQCCLVGAEGCAGSAPAGVCDMAAVKQQQGAMAQQLVSSLKAAPPQIVLYFFS